ncbi:unnamed protein product [Peniophora sp. CBMAI 1063]|nr:unnamed protein product [Peniophora sp. CBMAI 1063]
MSLSPLAIGLIAGLGGASLLFLAILLTVLQRRKSSATNSTSPAGIEGGTVVPPTVPSVVPLNVAQQTPRLTAKAQEVLALSPSSIPGSPYTPSSPPPIYQAHKMSDSYSSLDKKTLPISPPTIVTNLSRYSGVVSSPFGIPLSPILASPNPRTASYSSKVSSTIPSLRPSVAAELSGSWLPRYMTVCATFTPRAEDEMLITLGENLRLLEIFEDQWCLVQRVGKLEGELGVVPTFCLADPLPVKDSKARLQVPQPPFLGSGHPRATTLLGYALKNGYFACVL